MLQTLQDSDNSVIRPDLEVLARISLDSDKRLNMKQFDMVNKRQTTNVKRQT